MTPDIEKYRQCVAELEEINTSLRSHLIEAGLQPVVGESATEAQRISVTRLSDTGGCVPRELSTPWITGPTGTNSLETSLDSPFRNFVYTT